MTATYAQRRLSQLDTLEMPQADERVVSLDIETPLTEMVSRVVQVLR